MINCTARNPEKVLLSKIKKALQKEKISFENLHNYSGMWADGYNNGINLAIEFINKKLNLLEAKEEI